MNKKQKMEQIKEAISNARNDGSVTEACDWAYKLNKIGEVLAIISFILGVICAFVYAGQIGRYSSGAGVGVFITVLILFGLASAFTYIIFHVISIALEVLGGVLQYSRQTAELQSVLIESVIDKDDDEIKEETNKPVSKNYINNAKRTLEHNNDLSSNFENPIDNSKKEKNQDSEDLGFRKCPNCSMKFYNNEKRCTYCGEWLIK